MNSLINNVTKVKKLARRIDCVGKEKNICIFLGVSERNGLFLCFYYTFILTFLENLHIKSCRIALCSILLMNKKVVLLACLSVTPNYVLTFG